jgi:hypothetical protein
LGIRQPDQGHRRVNPAFLLDRLMVAVLRNEALRRELVAVRDHRR